MKRIIIVDDSETARMFIRRCLEIIGFDGAGIIDAANGREALEKLKQGQAEIVLTDLNMPVMDGETLLKWIKASPSLCELPVVVISSAGNPAKEEELIQIGALGVVAKPVSPPKLIALLGSFLA
ncbi:MAG: response regulator [Thermodesulfobacteriota bacterium]